MQHFLTPPIRSPMASVCPLTSLFLLIFIFYIYACMSAASSDDSPKTYIVHVSKSQKPSLFTTHHDWYSSILRSLHYHDRPPTTKLLYTYDHAIHGFANRLNTSQAAGPRRRRGILSVIPDSIRQLQTTRTPHFLGLADNFGLWPDSNYAEDIVIGIIDTGIWPDHPSFFDEGLSSVPSSWNGECEVYSYFPSASCNKKLIGARAYYKSYEEQMGMSLEEMGEWKSPWDFNGHGTHAASTTGGSVVKNAGFYEYAKGEARGMAIKARIAAYKACWSGGCVDSDVLAGMNQAIADGVHVISLSVGGGKYAEYDLDPIAVGAFRAMKQGIVTSCAAGNSGPRPYTAVNIAPWILTVGASTIDREFPADVVLGDGSIFSGVSLYSGDPIANAQLPLVHAADGGSRFCHQGKLDPSKVKGKIVVCDRGGNISGVSKEYAVKIAGGSGMVLASTEDYFRFGKELWAEAHLIPATMVGITASNEIKRYITSDPFSATATIIFRGTVTGNSVSAAPKVAAFSSRGPSRITPEILKPDVIAPGVNILAGWTRLASPSRLDDIDKRRVDFNIMSGTSMACPHVSGLIVALLRKAYPGWTPAAIKSVLMTTAYNKDNEGNNIMDISTGGESTPFNHGSGHVDPNKALNPGLVYNMGTSDHVKFLCALGYSPRRIAVLINDNSCPVDCNAQKLDSVGDLNYPSFSVVFTTSKMVTKHTRVVKNVGSKLDAVYDVKVNAPQSVEVNVSPSKLIFSQGKDTLSYEVLFISAALEEVGETKSAFGSLEWSDGEHVVRGPIAVVWNLASSVASM